MTREEMLEGFLQGALNGDPKMVFGVENGLGYTIQYEFSKWDTAKPGEIPQWGYQSNHGDSLWFGKNVGYSDGNRVLLWHTDVFGEVLNEDILKKYNAFTMSGFVASKEKWARKKAAEILEEYLTSHLLPAVSDYCKEYQLPRVRENFLLKRGEQEIDLPFALEMRDLQDVLSGLTTGFDYEAYYEDYLRKHARLLAQNTVDMARYNEAYRNHEGLEDWEIDMYNSLPSKAMTVMVTWQASDGSEVTARVSNGSIGNELKRGCGYLFYSAFPNSNDYLRVKGFFKRAYGDSTVELKYISKIEYRKKVCFSRKIA